MQMLNRTFILSLCFRMFVKQFPYSVLRILPRHVYRGPNLFMSICRKSSLSILNYAVYSDLYNHDDVDDDGNYIVAPTGPLVAGQLIAMHCSGPES